MRRRPARRGSGDAVITVEISNRSDADVDAEAAEQVARSVLSSESVTEGELGIAFVGPDEIRGLKREHLGIDEETDVLSFPLDGRDEVPTGVPRALGDVVLCPHVVGDAWQAPLVHGILHLLGYEHGAAMEAREQAYSG
jgi:probable rRNA maturation factor